MGNDNQTDFEQLLDYGIIGLMLVEMHLIMHIYMEEVQWKLFLESGINQEKILKI